MDQTGAGWIAHHKAAFRLKGLTQKQLFQKRLPFPNGHDRSFRQRPSELFVEDADRTSTQNRTG